MKTIDVPVIENQREFCFPITCREENLETQGISSAFNVEESEEVLKKKYCKIAVSEEN